MVIGKKIKNFKFFVKIVLNFDLSIRYKITLKDTLLRKLITKSANLNKELLRLYSIYKDYVWTAYNI